MAKLKKAMSAKGDIGPKSKRNTKGRVRRNDCSSVVASRKCKDSFRCAPHNISRKNSHKIRQQSEKVQWTVSPGVPVKMSAPPAGYEIDEPEV